MKSYAYFLEKLYRLKTVQKHNLDELREIHGALGSPSSSFETIHVGGTNGKGSVATKIAKGCEHAGRKTGLFTSPHISCFRERIQIDGILISEDRVVKLLDRLFSLAEIKKASLSFFDITTLMAFLYFAEENVDIAVIEVGLGGRLDATNIIAPKLSVITSVSLDHTEILGKTIEEIATEKAGIVKEKTPIVIGPQVPKEIIAPIARKNGSPLCAVEGVFDDYAAENAAIAKTCMEIIGLPDQAQAAGSNAQPPCRLELFNLDDVSVVLDAAHNPDGLKRSLATIKKSFPDRELRIVAGLSKSKDADACAEILQTFGRFFYLVEASNGLGLSSVVLSEKLKPSVRVQSTDLAVKQAISDARETAEIVVVCGSFYILGEARQALIPKTTAEIS